MRNPDFILPSKSQVKAKYGISNDDFEVLATPRTPRVGETLEQVGNYFGVPVRMLKRCTPVAVVVAVIFYPCWLPEAQVKFEKNLLIMDATYCAPFRNLPKQSTPWIPLAGHVAMTANTVTSISNIVHLSPEDGTSWQGGFARIERV